MNPRLTVSAVASALALMLVTPAANAQAKSSIQDDPKSSSCSENCVDAGYEWAVANTPAADGECAAKNEDFAAGCAHWLQEQRDAAAPPLEEPMDAQPDANAPPPEGDSLQDPPQNN